MNLGLQYIQESIWKALMFLADQKWAICNNFMTVQWNVFYSSCNEMLKYLVE